MSRWMTEQRPAVRDALTGIIDGLYNDLTAEFQKKEDARGGSAQEELRKLRAEISRLRNVESENRSLKERNLALSSSLQQVRDDAKTNPPLDQGSNSSSTQEKSLEVKLARTKVKCAHLKDSLDQAVAMLRKRKDELERWASYADGQDAKIKKLERRVQMATQGDAPDCVMNGSGTRYKKLEGDDMSRAKRVLHRPSLTPSSLGVSFDGSVSVAHANSSSNALQRAHQSPRRAISEPTSVTAHNEPTETVDSVASTQGETEVADDELPPQLPMATAVSPPRAIKEEPSSDDGPIHVMSRPVNKRKRTTPEPAGPAGRICRIKTDGSDPVMTDEFVYFDPQESMDLDEGQTTLETPRKRQLLALSRLLSSHGGHGVDSTPIAIAQLPRLGRQMPAGAAPVSIVGPPPASHDGGQPARNTASPLRPISANRQMTKTNGSGQLIKDARWRLADGISELAGDGHDYVEPLTAAAAATTGSSVPAKGEGKLRSLLNTPSLENATPLSSRLVQKTHQVPRSAPQMARVVGALLPILGAFAHDVATPSKTQPPKRIAASTPAQKQPRDAEVARQKAELLGRSGTRTAAAAATPVRFKPLSSLTRQDFKINPKYNDGEKFAFAEVVRGRADRESLSGCVDPDCCGKFFGQMAQSERKAMGPSLVHRSENIKLMEDYLGDDAHLLDRMTQDKKEALWLKARTKELADKYGKHRHRFHRQSSPPGFWDTGFPSTQEQQREREEAERMERALIAERYREAMRKEGRWLFRDE